MAFGPTAQITYATPLKMRLLFAGAPTLTIRGDRGGANNQVFALGCKLDFSVYGPAGSAYAIFFGAGFQPPLILPFASGFGRVALNQHLGLGLVPGAGPGQVNLTIPGNPTLVGFLFGFQAVLLDPLFNISFTCAADALINS